MKIPCIEVHRGVEIQDFQTQERIKTVVRPAIDAVFALTTADELFAIASDPAHPPELRLLAAALIQARDEDRQVGHTRRPGARAELALAWTAGLDALRWADPDRYCADCDPPTAAARAAPRPAEQRARLVAAQRSAA